mgnify:CR=1 FL=1
MKGLSGVENNQGIIGFFPKPAWTESDLTGRVIALEGIQDPGNLGTVIRTAAALGGFSIISSGSGVSFYNPKVVRASAGYLFSVPFLSGLSHRDLVRKGYHLWYACPSEGIPLPETELEVPLAILFGSEGSGLDRDNIAAEGRKLMIPMNGEMDSLNVAVASSIVMYEINRRSMINNAQG